jgi:general secretion pathway protein B
MSYILDALKRADAERERGHVPGLHSQSPAALTPPAPAGRRRPLPGTALIAVPAVLLLMAAAALWWWLSSAPGSPPAPPPATQEPQVNAGAADPAPPAVAGLVVAPPAPALPILTPAPPPPPVAPAPVAASPVPAPAADGAAKVRSLNELPPEIRAQLPQVNISGGTYSSNRDHRMLIANGKVVREGEEIAPGLQLESMAPGKAVLNHQGTRYSVGY